MDLRVSLYKGKDRKRKSLANSLNTLRIMLALNLLPCGHKNKINY